MSDDLDTFMNKMMNPPNKTLLDKTRNRLRKHGFQGYNLWAILTTPSIAFGNIPRGVKADIINAYQRARRGYGYVDTFSLDGYLLSWLPDAIRDIRLQPKGTPARKDATSLHDQDQYLTLAEWDDILLRIETGLRAGAKIDDIGNIDECDTLNDEFLEAWNLMGEWFHNLWT